MSSNFTTRRRIDFGRDLWFGALVLLVSFPLLFWNEGRAVAAYNSLTEGAASVISVTADTLNSANEGKLVYVTGKATTTDMLIDPDFCISVPALRMKRTVQMYQWNESSRDFNNRTTYSYNTTWSDTFIDSKKFQQPSGHENPTMTFTAADYVAANAKLQAFTLSTDLVQKMSGNKALAVNSVPSTIPGAFKGRTQVVDGNFYIGTGTLASPQVGDTQIKFSVIDPTTISVIAQQSNNRLVPYPTKAGDPIALVAMSEQSAREMFKTAEDENNTLTWVFRGVGFFAMFVGLVLLMEPLTRIANLIPLVDALIQFASMGVAFVFTVVASTLVISLAWLFYRPQIGLIILGAGLLAGAVTLVVVSLWARLRRK